jgi:hypothetical protein
MHMLPERKILKERKAERKEQRSRRGATTNDLLKRRTDFPELHFWD